MLLPEAGVRPLAGARLDMLSMAWAVSTYRLQTKLSMESKGNAPSIWLPTYAFGADRVSKVWVEENNGLSTKNAASTEQEGY